MSVPGFAQIPPQPPRKGRVRERRGRGVRGPSTLPGPLTPRGVGYPGTASERFDALVLSLVADLGRRWGDRWGSLEFAVEETPLVPEGWDGTEVPLGTLVRGSDGQPSRIVVFRQPIVLRAPSRPETTALLLAVLVEQVADLLGLEPEEVDPRYEG